MFKQIVLQLGVIIFYVSCYLANESNGNEDKVYEQKLRAKLVSFKALDDDIKLGLKFELPFLKVPLKKRTDAYGNEPALININTAALLSTGLLAASSALVSVIFRKYVGLERKDTISEKGRSVDNISQHDHELWNVINNLKLIYRNSSGSRVDSSMADLFSAISDTFEKSDIDLKACIQKAICSRLQLTAQRISAGNASAVDKIVDGLMGIKWLSHFLRHTSLNDTIYLRNSFPLHHQSYNEMHCDHKYSQCEWSVPEENLIDIIKTYLKFM